MIKHLAAKMEAATTVSHAGSETPQSQLNKYIMELQEQEQHSNALAYWIGRHTAYNCLADTALDLLTYRACFTGLY
jgi:hypothetical protein